jgi:hypothetical protein
MEALGGVTVTSLKAVLKLPEGRITCAKQVIVPEAAPV